MADAREQRRVSGVGVGAIVLAASAVLAPVMLGQLFALIVKRVNPDGVDVTLGLAYLRPILVFSAVAIVVFVVGSAVVNVVVGRRDRTAGRIAWIVWGLQIGFAAAFAFIALGDAQVTGRL